MHTYLSPLYSEQPHTIKEWAVDHEMCFIHVLASVHDASKQHFKNDPPPPHLGVLERIFLMKLFK